MTDDYQASDFAWLDMKVNELDVVIGPIETYEDQLFGYKAAHEAYVLVKIWSGVCQVLKGSGLPIPREVN